MPPNAQLLGDTSNLLFEGLLLPPPTGPRVVVDSEESKLTCGVYPLKFLFRLFSDRDERSGFHNLQLTFEVRSVPFPLCG